MSGYLPSFDSTGLFRGSGAGIVPYSTCADTARPGQMPSVLGAGLLPSLRRSHRRSFRQRGGRCPCQMGGSRKNRGVSRKNRYSRKQRGGAGFAVNPMDNQLGKVAVFDTTACQMPRPPTQFGGGKLMGANIGIVDSALAGSSGASTSPWTPGSGPANFKTPDTLKQRRRKQRGGAALVGSPVESMTQSISGTTMPSSGLVYPATTAGYSFDLAGSKNFKDTYAVVAPMDARRRSRKGRGRK
jgi:hypothetical protein